MNELEERVRVLENKVKLLEEAFETLKNMNLSEQMGDYVEKKSKSLKMMDLLNSMTDESKINFDKEKEQINKVQNKKRNIDNQIKQALKNVSTFSDDLLFDPSLFNYEIESGTYIDTTFRFRPETKKIESLLPFVGKGIRITAYNGFDTKRIVIPSTIDGKPVTSIGEKTFINSEVVEVILPKTLKGILPEAFKGCKKLKNINFPNNLSYLGEHCFQESGLVSFECPDSLKMIPLWCFYNCSELRNVNLGQVEKIDYSAFSCCYNLSRLDLPETLKEIELKCLNETKVNTIIFPKGMKKVSRDLFGDSSFRNKTKNITCVFLGKETIVDVELHKTFNNVSLIYCLPGSKIQQMAREKSIPIKPLSEFRLEEYYNE